MPGPVPTSPANNDFKPGFATTLMSTDLGLAMDAVKSAGTTAPLGSHAAEIYAKSADHTDKDFSAVHRDDPQRLTGAHSDMAAGIICGTGPVRQAAKHRA